VPPQAGKGDLLLFYRTRPDGFVRDLFRLTGPVVHVPARWKPGKDYMAPIQRVCTLKAPIHFTQLQHHRVLKNAGFVRGQMRGRYRASEYWPDLYRMIIGTNPGVKKALKECGPERLA